MDPSIVSLLIKDYSTDFVREYFDALEKIEPDQSYVAVNTLKTEAAELINVFSKEGVRAELVSDGLLKVHFTANPASLKSFKDGLFHVIGFPSYITAERLMVRPGETVIDLCSAPGGKTFSLAYQMKNKGKIIAVDIHQHKIEALKEQAKRLGIKNIEFVCADASKLHDNWMNVADKILCDVPCSGLGIIRKKPDIRYKDLSTFDLYETQSNILRNGLQYLKSSGRLVYSTCTVCAGENRNIVDLHAAHVVEDKIFLPQTDQTEGFYYAVIEKETV